MRHFFENRRSYAYAYLDELIRSYDTEPDEGTDLMAYAGECSGWVEEGAEGTLKALAPNSHRFTVKTLGSYRSSLQASYAGLPMKAGETYTLTFKASSSVKNATCRVHFQNPETYERAFEKELTLITTPKTFTITVEPLLDVGTSDEETD